MSAQQDVIAALAAAITTSAGSQSAHHGLHQHLAEQHHKVDRSAGRGAARRGDSPDDQLDAG